MTPESIPGLSIPQEHLKALIDALAETHEDNVAPLPVATGHSEAA